jgi:hypothetical protein
MSDEDAGANKSQPTKSQPSSGVVHLFSRYSTVLLKLAPGQEVSFEFIARRGIGKVRLLWFRAAVVAFWGFVAACLAAAPLRLQSLGKSHLFLRRCTPSGRPSPPLCSDTRPTFA